jgi:hypothetical protein
MYRFAQRRALQGTIIGCASRATWHVRLSLSVLSAKVKYLYKLFHGVIVAHGYAVEDFVQEKGLESSSVPIGIIRRSAPELYSHSVRRLAGYTRVASHFYRGGSSILVQQLMVATIEDIDEVSDGAGHTKVFHGLSPSFDIFQVETALTPGP